MRDSRLETRDTRCWGRATEYLRLRGYGVTGVAREAGSSGLSDTG